METCTRIEALSLAIARHWEPECEWPTECLVGTLSRAGWFRIAVWSYSDKGGEVHCEQPRSIDEPEIFVRLLKALLESIQKSETDIEYRRRALELMFKMMQGEPELAIAEAFVKAFGVKVEPL